MSEKKRSLLKCFLPLIITLQVFFQLGHGQGFIKTSGTHFMLNGKRLYLNGFNAYWMMYMASDQTTRPKVTSVLQQASVQGMNVARTWAFSDGGYRPLQSSPGSYGVDMFKGLDFVISEAKKYGVYLILSMVNNWDAYGGKKQYVKWAKERGQVLNSEDDFFTNSAVRQYYKNHVKALLTRVNSISGVPYKDDPTILAWELINEPRCPSDLSGKALQDWITEMATHVKSIDKNHLLEVGLEGFYGRAMQVKQFSNPAYLVGTDFISNNQVPGIDFATIHLYPDQWLPAGSDEQAQATFLEQWIQTHIEDSSSILRKPILLTEFGKSSKSPGYVGVSSRDNYFNKINDLLYSCAKAGGPCGGELVWQLMASGMDNFKDGYDIVLDQSPSTAVLIAQQSRRFLSLSK